MMQKARNSQRKPEASPRARRFEIRAPVRYRADDGVWHRGTTENISHSGLLLRGDGPLAVNTPIELIVELPQMCPAESFTRVLCRGHVVRADARAKRAGLVAAAITHYRLGRIESVEGEAPSEIVIE
jgi:PilZ domain-containing protein